MKSIFKTFAIASIALLASCGGKKEEATTTPEETKTETSSTTTPTPKGTAYNIMTGETEAIVKWTGYKLAKTDLSSHFGKIPVTEGKIYIDGEELTGGEVTVDVSGLIVDDLKDAGKKAELEEHLKNEDFFEVEKYPTAKVVFTNVKKEGEKYIVSGDFTIKGKVVNVTFPADFQKIGDDKLIFNTEKFTINRQNFDVNFSLGLKDVLIKDDVELEAHLEAKK